MVQFPHSLQKSVSTAIWKACSTRQALPEPGPDTILTELQVGQNYFEGPGLPGLQGQVGADPDAQAAELVAIKTAGCLGARLLLVVGEHDLVEIVPFIECSVRHGNPPLPAAAPEQQLCSVKRLGRLRIRSC